MGKCKLNYRFHDPNCADVAAKYIAQILVQAQLSKIDEFIRASGLQEPQQNETENER